MAQTPGTYLSLFVPEILMDQIERFRYRQKVPSRVEAIRMLIGRGLLFVPPDDFHDPKLTKPKKSRKSVTN